MFRPVNRSKHVAYMLQQTFAVLTYTVFTRVIHSLFNQNFVSKFRVRHLCEETILRK